MQVPIQLGLYKKRTVGGVSCAVVVERGLAQSLRQRGRPRSPEPDMNEHRCERSAAAQRHIASSFVQSSIIGGHAEAGAARTTAPAASARVRRSSARGPRPAAAGGAAASPVRMLVTDYVFNTSINHNHNSF